MINDDLAPMEHKKLARAIRSNPKFRGHRFKDMPRLRRYEGYSFVAGLLLVVFGGLLTITSHGVGAIFIALGVLAFNFLALPYVLSFVGYWFPPLALLAAKFDLWLEKDFKE